MAETLKCTRCHKDYYGNRRYKGQATYNSAIDRLRGDGYNVWTPIKDICDSCRRNAISRDLLIALALALLIAMFID